MNGGDMSLGRISTLFPLIIDHILCLLPIKDAVRTSILSREWRYTWTRIPVLRFNKNEFEGSETYLATHLENLTTQLAHLEQTIDLPRLAKEMIRSYMFFDAIKQTLLLHQGPLLEFSLTTNAGKLCVDLDQILSNLSRRNTVKSFFLLLDRDSEYRLPSSIFSMYQLTYLCLRNGYINHQPTFKGFGNLTSLELQHVKISTKTLVHLVSNCPILKSLWLYTSEDNVLGDGKFPITCLIELLPLIECLIIDPCILHYFFLDWFPQELSISLVHLKDVHIKGIRLLESDGLRLLFFLIQCSPNLEKLCLDVDNAGLGLGLGLGLGSDPEVLERYNRNPIRIDRYSNIWLNNLNEFEIRGFFNFKLHLEIVQLILVKSPVLKKVILRPLDMVTKNEYSTITKILLKSPCISASADIFLLS
ncbi:F-box/FBD/LRR-repeat protein At1g13570-like isoform X2 [Rutidosis leptorrhynchoides]|uniref:F-box/FBD/LRR-repeat protein At1g13570-like isoform X2 n=1 Tax=Rutidosis leptorrhynchoides TaxID=125765 RepID=UPI003A98F86E